MQRKRIRYQVIKTLISDIDTPYTIDVELDKQYERAKRISMFTDPAYANNRNLEFIAPLNINNVELFPEKFDSALLFPLNHNEHFTEIDEEAKASRLRVQVIDKNTAMPAEGAYYLTIVVQLENPLVENDDSEEQRPPHRGVR